MYYQHRAFKTPDRETVIWRYLSLSKFLSLLNSRSLYLARSDQFFDKNEGKLSEMDKKLFDSFVPDISNRIEKEGIGCSFIQCWVMNPEELFLMWETYSSLEEGIAIKSTVGQLIDSLDSKDERNIIISDVSYKNYSKDYTFDKAGGFANLLAPLFCKRTYFCQEMELRLVYHDYNMSILDNVMGVVFKVDLNKLIDSVWVAPNAGEWYIDVINKEMLIHGINKPLNCSGISNNMSDNR